MVRPRKIAKTWWALVQYVEDGLQKKVSVEDIFKEAKSKSCIRPTHAKDFIPTHEYQVKWYLCTEDGAGERCDDLRSHPKQNSHPSVLYAAFVLQLAESLDGFGGLPPVRHAPKRIHSVDIGDDAPQDALRKHKKAKRLLAQDTPATVDSDESDSPSVDVTSTSAVQLSNSCSVQNTTTQRTRADKDVDRVATEQSDAELTARKAADEAAIAAREAAERELAVREATAQAAIAAREAAERELAVRQAADQAAIAAREAAERELAVRQAADQAAIAAREAAERELAVRRAADQAAIAARERAELELAGREDQQVHDPIIQGAGAAPIPAPQRVARQGPGFAVYNPAVDFPNDAGRRQDGYGVARLDREGNLRRASKSRELLVQNTLLHYHTEQGLGYQDRLRRLREDDPQVVSLFNGLFRRRAKKIFYVYNEDMYDYSSFLEIPWLRAASMLNHSVVIGLDQTGRGIRLGRSDTALLRA
ncbi:hypothetical protein QAD02_011823 [Eretmocerus hayati]|uniref:Uncharacterized protein n=1 Tax=Eretmocerus hayati TaxID=131215 RepID=A0ACC2NY46_9HYME|nr:hypothetical protein QAD02_011823 [Eretmocerus hayati]